MKSLSPVSFSAVVLLTITSATFSKAATPQDNFHLTPLWSLAPNSRTYLPSDTDAQGRTPLYRSIAYNALSNQVYIVSRTGPSAGLKVNVLDAATGADLYQLNTTGISGGSIVLLSIDVAQDGSIYACNMDTSAANAIANFKLYRWANPAGNTMPMLVYSGEPVDPAATFRWGDAIDVRGSGVGTQVIVDNQNSSARFMAVFTPTDSTLSSFTPTTFSLQNDNGGAIIGRSLEFGAGDTFWQKRKGAPLVKSSFNLISVPPGNISPLLAAYTNFPGSLGPVGLDLNRNLLAGINFSGSTTAPDTVDLYDVSDFSNPQRLGQYNFPVNEKPNGNFIGQVFFASNRVFAVNGNNGIVAYALEAGTPSPPVFLTHPQNLRLIVGGTGSLTASTADASNLKWQFNGSDIAGATNSTFTITNAPISSAGRYRVVASSSAGSTTSWNATVVVFRAEDQFALSQLWSLAPESRSYLPPDSDGQGRTPLYRGIAYNAASNQVYIVSRTGQISGLTVNVLDATTGADLYQLNTDGIDGGSIVLLGMGVAEDGAIYAANMDTSGAAGPAIYNVYRWKSSDPAVAPQVVFSGEPANQASPVRWGDTFDVRGSGANTEIIIDSNQGTFAAVLTPIDQSMTSFTNRFFSQSYPQPPIGRSLQFGTANTFWQKRSGGRLQWTSYNLANQTSTALTNYFNFSSSLGPVTLDLTRHLLAGINFSSSANSPDALDLYEISDLNTPMLIAKYEFPAPSRPNGNLIGQVIFAGNRVYAVDGNNGVVAFSIVAPSAPALTISRFGTTVTLAWANAGFVLQSSTSLTPPITWSDISNATQTSFTEAVMTGKKFYRLRKAQ